MGIGHWEKWWSVTECLSQALRTGGESSEPALSARVTVAVICNLPNRFSLLTHILLLHLHIFYALQLLTDLYHFESNSYTMCYVSYCMYKKRKKFHCFSHIAKNCLSPVAAKGCKKSVHHKLVFQESKTEDVSSTLLDTTQNKTFNIMLFMLFSLKVVLPGLHM